MSLLLVFLLCPASFAEEAKLQLVGDYVLTQNGAFFILKNTSGVDVFIKNTENDLAAAVGGKKNQFHRGKRLVYLRKKGSGFGSSQIALKVPERDLTRQLKGDLELSLNVATFDQKTRTVGNWKRVSIVFHERKDKKD